MRQALRWCVAASVFLGGGLAWLTLDVPTAPVPSVPPQAQLGQSPAFSFPSQETLLSPWALPRPKVVAKPVSVPPVAAPVAPASVRVDRSSVQFVGSSKDQDGQRTYFFKFAPTGQMLLLRLGEPQNGWNLIDVQDHRFGLQGPGGLYEVVR